MCSNLLIQLPLDILLNIIAHLELTDIRSLMLTCKFLKNVIMNENAVWRLISCKRLILQNRKSEFSWYNKCRISQNWCKGIYKSQVVIQHQTHYMPWLQFLKSEALYLSVGSHLRCYSIHKKGIRLSKILWFLKVPTIDRYDVRTNDISRFIVKDNVIVCGNRDGCVAVYEAYETQQKPSLLFFIRDSHANGLLEVSAVEKIKNTIITVSSQNPYIKFWDWNNNENDNLHRSVKCKSEYKLPNEIGCRSVAANKLEDKLALGLNGNSKPILLDVNVGNFLMSSDDTRSRNQVITDVQWHDEHCIAYVTHAGRLQLIDSRSSAVIYDVRDPFQSSFYCLKTDSHHAMIVGSSEYSRCVLFDVRSPKHVQMYFTQKKSSPIYSLDFDSTKLIAAADRGVAALNFNVNTATTQKRDYSHAFEFINN